MSGRLAAATIWVAAFLLGFSPLWGQSPTANIVGRIVDETGASVPDARVSVRNVGSRELRVAFSDVNGEYVIAGLPPGNYRIVVQKQGFHRIDDRGVTLEVDQTARLDFRLQLGAVSEVVEVRATVPTLNTESAGKGDVIVSREMLDVPLDGRDFADLAYLVPGVGQKAQGANGSNFAVNGARTDNTNFIIDGFNNQNPRGGAAQARPPIDSLMEFKMQTAGYSAEYGRLAGGSMNMVLKSGTNRFRGTLFEFLRNDLFDARPFFDREKNKLRRNQFGVVFDGPVTVPKVYSGRNRTFFLINWEGYRQSVASSRFGVVPTEKEREGDFSQSLIQGATVPLVDPFTKGTCKSVNTTGACFPENKIPASRIDPIARQVMAYYPLPNRPGQANNYYANVNDTDHWDSFLGKIDHRLSDAHNLSFRMLKRFNRTSNPFAGSDLGTFGNKVRETQMLAGLTYTRIFSPALINEFRTGMTRTSNRTLNNYAGRNFAAEWGLTGGTDDPFLVAFPRFTILNMLPLGNAANTPIIFTVNNFQWADTLTRVKSRHLMKFGVDVMRTQFFQPYYNNNRGTYDFNGRWTNFPFADFLLGVLNKFTRTVGTNPNYLFMTSYSLFAQDDYRITPWLTLNLGIRYEISKPPIEKYGRLASFIPELGKLVVADDRTVPNFEQAVEDAGLTGKVALARDYGLPKSLTYASYKCLAPRFGFALRPFGDVRTVVRGGYGIFYGNNLWNPVRNDLGNVFPFSVTQTFNKNNNKPEALTLQNPTGTKLNLGGVNTPNGFQLYPTPQYLQSWNLTFEREIAPSVAVEVAYVGSKGTHLGRKYNINQPFRIPELRLPGGGFPRPYDGFNDIDYYGFGFNSSYNAGIVTLRKRFARGFFYRVNYVYSKSIDYASQIADNSDGGYAGVQDARNFKLERGRSDWDRGHGVTMMLMYDLPLRGHWAVANWQVAVTGRLQTGPPFTVRTADVQLDQGEANRPDRIAKGTLPNPGPEMWFDLSAFPRVPVGAYHFGTAGRNILDGPGLASFNVSLMKRFRVRERSTVQFRCEMFNALNHPNFYLPSNLIGAPDAGMISRAQDPRTMQFGLRYQF